MRASFRRWLAVSAAAAQLGCGGPEDDEVVEGSAVVAADRAEPVTAAFEGDPSAKELEILDLSRAELVDEVLLGLPGSQGIPLDARASGLPRIPDGGMSAGSPQAGALRRGVQLPYNPALYTRRDPTRSYGSSHTIRTIQTALAAMRADGHSAEVIIGDISRPQGGKFSPHVSHQSGRDIDIRLVVAPGLDRATLPRAPEQVDWDATWALVHSFLETGRVRYVFLGFARQRHLHDAAQRAGIHPRVLDSWFQWPYAGDGGIVRHEDGHRAHVHIRLSCPLGNVHCRGA